MNDSIQDSLEEHEHDFDEYSDYLNEKKNEMDEKVEKTMEDH